MAHDLPNSPIVSPTKTFLCTVFLLEAKQCDLQIFILAINSNYVVVITIQIDTIYVAPQSSWTQKRMCQLAAIRGGSGQLRGYNEFKCLVVASISLIEFIQSSITQKYGKSRGLLFACIY